MYGSGDEAALPQMFQWYFSIVNFTIVKRLGMDIAYHFSFMKSRLFLKFFEF